jgi:tRNA (cmo5U34)-methyltransferase
MPPMNGLDNTSAHPAAEYDGNVRKSIPFYDLLHEAAINAVSSYLADPGTWVDVGCGTGTLVERAYDVFPTTRFILADPSTAMLDLARAKLRGRDRVAFLAPVAAEQLALAEPMDVVTAVQSLHYLDAAARQRALRTCFRLLRSGGMFVTFENIRPLTQKGTEIGKASWRRYEIAAGKSVEQAAEHVERFGREFFPITIEDHLRLLRLVGFGVVEMLWYSCVQAGFYCIK